MYIRNNEVTLFKYQANLTSSSQPRFELRSCRGQNLWYTLDREQASIQQKNLVSDMGFRRRSVTLRKRRARRLHQLKASRAKRSRILEPGGRSAATRASRANRSRILEPGGRRVAVSSREVKEPAHWNRKVYGLVEVSLYSTYFYPWTLPVPRTLWAVVSPEWAENLLA